MVSNPTPQREKWECLWYASVSAAAHKDSADKSTAWFRWDGGQLTLYPLSWTVSAVIKAKLKIKNPKKGIEWSSRNSFFMIIADNLCPSQLQLDHNFPKLLLRTETEH